MEKKEYITPVLTLLGDVEDLTKGEGRRGSHDQMFYLHWGSRGRKNDNDDTSG